MAGSTVGLKEGRATLRCRTSRLLLANGADIGCQVTDLGRLQQPVAAKCWHLRHTGGFVVRVSDAVFDGIVNCADIPTPQPIVVVEVRVSLGARRSGPMALNAVDLECRATAFDRGLHKLRVTGK